MASGEGSDKGDSWWTSWVHSAREKSISALNATKRDLAEFVTVVQRDTSQAVSDAAVTIRGMVTQRAEERSKTTPEGTVPHSPTVVYDRAQTQLQALRANPETYCTIPEGHAAEFLEWSNAFDLSAYQEQISQLLVDSGDVRRLHAELVPVKVSYEAFWHHYFYQVHLLEKEEAHRAAIMARAGSQGRLIDWEEEEEQEEGSPVEVKDGSDSSESFICVNEEVGWEGGPPPEGEPPKEGGPPQEEAQDASKQTTATPIKGGGSGGRGRGGHADSDSDWERWSD